MRIQILRTTCKFHSHIHYSSASYCSRLEEYNDLEKLCLNNYSNNAAEKNLEQPSSCGSNGTYLLLTRSCLSRPANSATGGMDFRSSWHGSEGWGQIFGTQRRVEASGLSRKSQGRRKENKMVVSQWDKWHKHVAINGWLVPNFMAGSLTPCLKTDGHKT